MPQEGRAARLAEEAAPAGLAGVALDARQLLEGFDELVHRAAAGVLKQLLHSEKIKNQKKGEEANKTKRWLGTSLARERPSDRPAP